MKHRFEAYCKNYQDIENYKKAKAYNFKGWCCHHRLETNNSDGERRLVDITVDELLALGMYYNRPASELIFLTSREHKQLHMKGEKNPMYGKKHSVEAINKMSEAHKNISEETKNKLSEAAKGRHWFNNGKENKFCYECPDGFVPGKLLIYKETEK